MLFSENSKHQNKTGVFHYVKHNGNNKKRLHLRIDPDGYNIILQGDIVRFVEMASEERRKIIEEIAGIDIYEDGNRYSYLVGFTAR